VQIAEKASVELKDEDISAERLIKTVLKFAMQ
jgi:hypothetical protein